MADYSIITNHTNYGMELIQQDPNMASNLAYQADSDVRTRTNGNYGISGVIIDFDNNLTYYDLEPLTMSAKTEMHAASLGMASLGWLETIRKIISVIVAVVALIIGAVVGGWGFFAAAVIAAGIILWNWVESKQEYVQEMTDINDEYARQLRDGEITQAEYDDFTEAKHKTMEAAEINWKTIAIYGLIGFAGLYALNMVLSKKK